IGRVRKVLRTGNLIEVDLAEHIVGVLVGEDAVARIVGEHQDVAVDRQRAVGVWQIEILVVDEEERLVATLHQLRNIDWSADVSSILPQYERIAWKPVDVVKVVI